MIVWGFRALYTLPTVSFGQLSTAPEAVRHYTEAPWTRLSSLVVPMNGQGHLDQSGKLRRPRRAHDHS